MLVISHFYALVASVFRCLYLVILLLTRSCSLAEIGAAWPFLLGGRAHWTVGLVATLISMSSIIAADTYAFLGGKVSLFLFYLSLRVWYFFVITFWK